MEAKWNVQVDVSEYIRNVVKFLRDAKQDI
jgi:hypothetical protein